MIRRLLGPNVSALPALMRVSDPVMTSLVGVAAHAIYLAGEPMADNYIVFLLGTTIAIAALFPLFRLYEAPYGVSFSQEIRRLLMAWMVVMSIVVGTIFATKSGIAFSRAWVAIWFLGGVATTATSRVLARFALRATRRRGLAERRIAIVGAGRLGEIVARRLSESAWTGFRVIGFYDDDPARSGRTVSDLPVIGAPELLVAAANEGEIDEVWITLPLRAEQRIRELQMLLMDSTADVRLVPDTYRFDLLNHPLTDIAGLPVVPLTGTSLAGRNRIVKAMEDYLLTAVLLLAALPAMAVIAVGVRLSSPGPILYRQDRVTWNGARFTMLKFRTMPVDAEAAIGPVWSQAREDRATPFGAFLRRLSLDELPQLFNVMKGEMSLIGPRPERPEFVEQFRRQIPGYMQKHRVKGGITGWAQIHDLRGSSDLARRIEYDLYYIDNWSVSLDLRILARTVVHLVRSRNAR